MISDLRETEKFSLKFAKLYHKIASQNQEKVKEHIPTFPA
jgi:hypothetical protein